MKGLGRSVIYWGYMLEKMFLFMVTTITAVVVVISMADGFTTLKELMSDMVSYLVMISVLIVFSGALNNGNIYFPLSVSLGSQRKKSFFGMQIMQHLIIAQILAILMSIYYFTDKETFGVLMKAMPCVVGAFLLLLMVGNLVSAACIRFGRNWGVILYIATFIAIWCFVFFAIMGPGKEGLNKELVDMFLETPALLIVGLAGDIIAMVWAFMSVRKKEIQFI